MKDQMLLATTTLADGSQAVVLPPQPDTLPEPSLLEQAIMWLHSAPKVDIKGRNYATVATRVECFRRFWGHQYRILTEVVPTPTQDAIRFKASIVAPSGEELASGHAEEKGGSDSGMINRTSAIENCETSAIGRALANFGLAGGEYAYSDTEGDPGAYASADEVRATEDNRKSGPGKMEIKAKHRELRDDILACEDLDSLVALLNKEETQDWLSYIQRFIPSWWYNPEYGMEAIITNRRKELEALEAEKV